MAPGDRTNRNPRLCPGLVRGPERAIWQGSPRTPPSEHLLSTGNCDAATHEDIAAYPLAGQSLSELAGLQDDLHPLLEVLRGHGARG